MTVDPFGVPWDALEYEHVDAYVRDAADEPLMVEAKGTGRREPGPKEKSRYLSKQVCGFGNSDLGGYLLLGVSEADDGFVVEGWDFGRDEPKPWVSRVVRDSIDPAPAIDVMNWPVEGSARQLVVVRIWPSPIPPCVTNKGEVYRRLPGETSPVRDAAELRRLFEKGEAGRAFARRQSRAGRAGLVHHDLPDGRGRFQGVIVSIGCPAFQRDLAAAIHRPSVHEAARALLRRPDWKTYTGGGSDPGMTVGRDISQHAFTAYSTEPGGDGEGYAIQLRRDGSVAVGACTVAHQDPEPGLGVLERVWAAAIELARMVGGITSEDCAPWPTHIAMRLGTQDKAVDIDRWANLDGPTDEQLESVRREVQWSLGRTAFIPE